MVQPRRQDLGLVARQGVCCQRDDWRADQSPFGFDLPDFARGLLSIHFRHRDIHENQVRPFRPERVDGLLAIRGEGQIDIQGLHEFAEDKPVGLVVFCRKDTHPAKRLVFGRAVRGRRTGILALQLAKRRKQIVSADRAPQNPGDTTLLRRRMRAGGEHDNRPDKPVGPQPDGQVRHRPVI